MEFVASYWWLWLVVLALSVGFTAFSHLQIIKGIVSSKSFSQVKSSFFSGFISLAITGVIAFVTSILLIVSIVLNIIDYAK